MGNSLTLIRNLSGVYLHACKQKVRQITGQYPAAQPIPTQNNNDVIYYNVIVYLCAPNSV